MNDINANSDMNDTMSQRAVSLYGQTDAMDDFPVLKAFQQYVDAEQEKARKRIITLGIFFGVVLVAVIVVFMILLQNINSRNQALSDRLVEYAMKESERRQTTVQQPIQQSHNDVALKAMTETLAAMQKKLMEKPAEPAKQPESSNAEQRKLKSETEKLVKAKALLDAEKKRVEAEKERLHQIEIDRQRRKLYPECYQDAASVQTSRRSPSRSATLLTEDDIRDIIREAYSDRDDEDALTGKKSVSRKKKRAAVEEDEEAEEVENPKVASEDSEVEDDSDAIEYFKDDEYKIPVDIKGSKVKFDLSVQ